MRRRKKETQEYWNKRLARMGLSVEAGRDPRTVYVGGTQEVTLIYELETSKHARSKRKPDADTQNQ